LIGHGRSDHKTELRRLHHSVEIPIGMPLIVDVGVGENWRDAK